MKYFLPRSKLLLLGFAMILVPMLITSQGGIPECRATTAEDSLTSIFPLYPGSEEVTKIREGLKNIFQTFSSGSYTGQAEIMALATHDSFARVIEYYDNNSPGRDWKKVLEIQKEEVSKISIWQKDGESAQLFIAKDEDRTVILLGYRKEETTQGNDWRFYTEDDGLLEDLVTVMVEGRDGAIWMGTNDGLMRFANSEWQNFEQDPLNHGVADLAISAEGTLWIGTVHGGVIKFDGSSWENFTKKDGLTNDHISSIDIGDDSRIWVSSLRRRGGISIYDGSSWFSYSVKNGLPTNYVYAVAHGPDGKVWAGTKKGLTHLTEEGWKTFTEEDGLIYNQVEDIAIDTTGAVWAITDKGVSRFNGESWVNYEGEAVFPSEDIFQISACPDGSIWFATKKGLTYYDGTKWKNYTAKDGLPDRYIISLLVTTGGEIWIGTFGEGVGTGKISPK